MKTTTALAGLILVASPVMALAQTPAQPPMTTAPGQVAPVQALTTQQYAALAYDGGDFLDRTSRIAFEKASDRRVRNFARAEVEEQVRVLAQLGDDVATGTVGGSVNVGPSPGSGRPVTGSPSTASGGNPALGTTGSTVAGAGVGALIGGPIGALVGAGVGYAGGSLAGGATTPQQKQEALAQLQSMPSGPTFDLAYVQVQMIGHQEALVIHSSYAQTGDDPELRRVAQNAVPLIRRHIATLERLNTDLSAAAR